MTILINLYAIYLTLILYILEINSRQFQQYNPSNLTTIQLPNNALINEQESNSSSLSENVNPFPRINNAPDSLPIDTAAECFRNYGDGYRQCGDLCYHSQLLYCQNDKLIKMRDCVGQPFDKRKVCQKELLYSPYHL